MIATIEITPADWSLVFIVLAAAFSAVFSVSFFVSYKYEPNGWGWNIGGSALFGIVGALIAMAIMGPGTTAAAKNTDRDTIVAIMEEKGYTVLTEVPPREGSFEVIKDDQTTTIKVSEANDKINIWEDK